MHGNNVTAEIIATRFPTAGAKIPTFLPRCNELTANGAAGPGPPGTAGTASRAETGYSCANGRPDPDPKPPPPPKSRPGALPSTATEHI